MQRVAGSLSNVDRLGGLSSLHCDTRNTSPTFSNEGTFDFTSATPANREDTSPEQISLMYLLYLKAAKVRSCTHQDQLLAFKLGVDSKSHSSASIKPLDDWVKPAFVAFLVLPVFKMPNKRKEIQRRLVNLSVEDRNSGSIISSGTFDLKHFGYSKTFRQLRVNLTDTDGKEYGFCTIYGASQKRWKENQDGRLQFTFSRDTEFLRASSDRQATFLYNAFTDSIVKQIHDGSPSHGTTMVHAPKFNVQNDATETKPFAMSKNVIELEAQKELQTQRTLLLEKQVENEKKRQQELELELQRLRESNRCMSKAPVGLSDPLSQVREQIESERTRLRVLMDDPTRPPPLEEEREKRGSESGEAGSSKLSDTTEYLSWFLNSSHVNDKGIRNEYPVEKSQYCDISHTSDQSVQTGTAPPIIEENIQRSVPEVLPQAMSEPPGSPMKLSSLITHEEPLTKVESLSNDEVKERFSEFVGDVEDQSRDKVVTNSISTDMPEGKDNFDYKGENFHTTSGKEQRHVMYEEGVRKSSTESLDNNLLSFDLKTNTMYNNTNDWLANLMQKIETTENQAKMEVSAAEKAISKVDGFTRENQNDTESMCSDLLLSEKPTSNIDDRKRITTITENTNIIISGNDNINNNSKYEHNIINTENIDFETLDLSLSQSNENRSKIRDETEKLNEMMESWKKVHGDEPSQIPHVFPKYNNSSRPPNIVFNSCSKSDLFGSSQIPRSSKKNFWTVTNAEANHFPETTAKMNDNINNQKDVLTKSFSQGKERSHHNIVLGDSAASSNLLETSKNDEIEDLSPFEVISNEPTLLSTLEKSHRSDKDCYESIPTLPDYISPVNMNRMITSDDDDLNVDHPLEQEASATFDIAMKPILDNCINQVVTAHQRLFENAPNVMRPLNEPVATLAGVKQALKAIVNLRHFPRGSFEGLTQVHIGAAETLLSQLENVSSNINI